MGMRWLTSTLVALAAASALLVGDGGAAAAAAERAVVPVAQQGPLVQHVPDAAPRRVAGTPCSSTARACVELSSNRAWLIRNGRVSYGPVPISHGRRGHRTPPGTFRVTFRNIDHVSSIYGTPMPYSVFFNGGIAFHQGDIRSGSAGCVRMQRAAAREFYSSLRRGDVVQVVR